MTHQSQGGPFCQAGKKRNCGMGLKAWFHTGWDNFKGLPSSQSCCAEAETRQCIQNPEHGAVKDNPSVLRKWLWMNVHGFDPEREDTHCEIITSHTPGDEKLMSFFRDHSWRLALVPGDSNTLSFCDLPSKPWPVFASRSGNGSCARWWYHRKLGNTPTFPPP